MMPCLSASTPTRIRAERESASRRIIYPGKAARLAAAIHREVCRASGTPNRGVRTRRRLFVLRNNRLPAVLVEVGFLTNAVDGPRLAISASYREQIAAAIARGVESAF